MPAKILYIEDNLLNMILMRDTIRAMNYEFLSAFDANEGIHKAQSMHPDLVLMDFDLFDSKGIRVLQRLRQDSLTEHIPIIVLVTSTQITSDLGHEPWHYDACLIKPAHLQTLRVTIQQILHRDANQQP